MLRYRHKLVPNVSELPSEMSKLLYDDGKVLKFSRQNSKITTTYHFFQVLLSIPLGRQFENSLEKYSRSMFHHNSEILFYNDGVYEKIAFFSSCLFTFLTVLLLPLFFHYFSTQRPLNNRLTKNKMVVQYEQYFE